MSPINFIIWSLWGALILLKFGLAIVLPMRGMARAYPMLELYAAAAFARSMWLLYWMWHDGRPGFFDAYANSDWVPMLTMGLVALGAFWAPSGFRDFRLPSIVIASALAIGAVVAAVTFSTIAAGIWPQGHREAADALLERNVAMGSGMFLMFTRFFYREFRPEWIAPNARIYIDVLLLMLASQFAGLGLIHAGLDSYTTNAIAQIIKVGVPCVCFWVWIRRLKPEGQSGTPIPAMTKEEYRKAASE